MKITHYIAVLAVALTGLSACEEGIDPITPLQPGEDMSTPVVNIVYPQEGSLIRSAKDTSTIKIEIEAEDDIELKTVVLKLDNVVIGTYNTFLDYRRAAISHEFAGLINGAHTLTVEATDLSGKSSSGSVSFEKAGPYNPKYAGEVFYMPFDGDFMELVSNTEPTRIGTMTFGPAKISKGVNGNTDSYLRFPLTNIKGGDFSAVFWYKVNASPDRAGIITIGNKDSAELSNDASRKLGLRLFREASAAKQRIKLNVGTGTAEVWNDGQDITPDGNWVHIGITVSATGSRVYLNGVLFSNNNASGTAAMTAPMNWNGCSFIEIGSGGDSFAYWNHKSDLSMFDEMRIFKKALTTEEILAIYDAEK